MTRHDTYLLDGTPKRSYQKAWERKEELRADGWRVKIRKNADGHYLVWKKRRDNIDTWNNDHRFGCRRQTRKIPKWVMQRAMS